MQAIVSIHDVMPHTLDHVQELLDMMVHLESRHITLLVVPGLDWTPQALDQLKGFEQAGFRLAGHGWIHHAGKISTLYHRLHAALISRQAAEHLSLSASEISTLINNCYQWFADRQLEMPDLYVPPAWAMGNISKAALAKSPFRYFETTSGMFDSESGKEKTLPLAGFEADNHFRSLSLTCWNGINKMVSTTKKPLRLSVHPNDHHLLMKGSLKRTLSEVSTALPYASVV